MDADQIRFFEMYTDDSRQFLLNLAGNIRHRPKQNLRTNIPSLSRSIYVLLVPLRTKVPTRVRSQTTEVLMR